MNPSTLTDLEKVSVACFLIPLPSPFLHPAVGVRSRRHGVHPGRKIMSYQSEGAVDIAQISPARQPVHVAIANASEGFGGSETGLPASFHPPSYTWLMRPMTH